MFVGFQCRLESQQIHCIVNSHQGRRNKARRPQVKGWITEWPVPHFPLLKTTKQKSCSLSNKGGARIHDIICLQMNSEENEVRKVIQNHRMTTMAELWIWAHPPIWLPAHWWQRHTKAAGSGAPAQQATALVPLPPSSSLYLPKKPSEFTILIKIVACGSRARNSQPSWATVKPTTQWVSLLKIAALCFK